MQNMILISTLSLLLYGIRFAISVEIAKESFHMTGASCGGDCSSNAMLDNNADTYWNAYNNVNYATPAWVTFDFGVGTAVRISDFDMASLGDTTHDTKDFTLQSAESVDGPFTTFYTGTAAAGTDTAQHFSIDINAQPLSGFRFVRLNLVTRYSQYQGCVREVDFEYDDVACATALDLAAEVSARISGDADLQAVIDDLYDVLASHRQGSSAYADVGWNVMNNNDMNNNDGVFSRVWLSYKDIIVVFLLVINLIAMCYVYGVSMSKRSRRRDRKARFVHYEDDSQENLV
eukprot:UN00744